MKTPKNAKAKTTKTTKSSAKAPKAAPAKKATKKVVDDPISTPQEIAEHNAKIDAMVGTIEDRVAGKAPKQKRPFKVLEVTPELTRYEDPDWRPEITCHIPPPPADLETKVVAATDMVPGSIRDLARGYIDSLANDATDSTRKSYAMDLERAIEFLGADTLVANLTRERVTEYFESPTCTTLRSGKPKAKPTVDKQRRVLRLALAWGAENGFGASPIEN